jgi:hypothetical protein
MGPCSPSCESAASDQTHMPCSTSCDTPVDDGSQSVSMRPERGLNYMLERSALSLLTSLSSNLICSLKHTVCALRGEKVIPSQMRPPISYLAEWAQLDRYLTTNTADKKRPPICQTEVKNSIMASSGVLQRRSSALQPEIVRAALRSSPAPVQSPIPTQTTSPQVVSVFSEASQSQVSFFSVLQFCQGPILRL